MNKIALSITRAWQKILLFFGHKGTWAKVLFEAAKKEMDFEEVKKTSPFADKIVVAVSYGMGTIFYGDIRIISNANGGIDFASSTIKNAIRSKGWTAHDSDDYVLAFRRDTGDVEIFWIGSGKPEVKSPESARRR